MKLLSWMRMIKQNVLHPSMEFKGDFCCLRAQVSSEVQDITNSFSFSSSHYSNPPRVEEELRFDEDGFCGFLAIGTLGTDPETPKFSAPVAQENVAGEKEEIAKLISEKLDKFLEESPEDTSSKQVERSNAEGNRDFVICPLQGYDLFPSSVELTKRSNGGVKMKSGLLTSLFKRRRKVEGECSMKKHGTKDLIKKIFEKLHGSSSKTRFDYDDDPIPKKKDLRKSVQIFRSKVHPVLPSPARDDDKIDDRRNCINRSDLRVPSLTGAFLSSSSVSEANKKRENWINTDAEYLVLEL